MNRAECILEHSGKAPNRLLKENNFLSLLSCSILHAYALADVINGERECQHEDYYYIIILLCLTCYSLIHEHKKFRKVFKTFLALIDCTTPRKFIILLF